MSVRPFGHVSDPERDRVQAPPFTQEQVDYLKEKFLAIGPAPATTLDEAIRVVSWAGADFGQRSLIAHLQEIVDSRKPNTVTA